MSYICRIVSACILFLAATHFSHAQGTRVRVPPPPIATPVAAPGAAGATPSAPSNLRAIGRSNKEIDLAWTASTEVGGTIATYQLQRCQGATCSILSSSTTSYSDTTLTPNTPYTYKVVAVDASGTKSGGSNPLSVTTAPSAFTCVLFPTWGDCMDFEGANKQDAINSFYQTNGPFSFFSQVKAIYNNAAGAATVSADLGSLNFPNGMQVTLTTNVQAGSSGTTAANSGAVPTLSANGAAQATQNLIYGGTFLASEMYPLVAAGASKLGSPGGVGLFVDFIAKEGADVQNFKSGTNVSVTSPPFHGSAHVEGYLQYNSINLLPNSQNFAGSVFAGGSYGYNTMSHVYAQDYGFGNKVNSSVGQLSFGIVLNGVARVTVSRAFGPSQTYVDSTSMVQTTVNNFKAWSLGIVYQSPTPAK
jgi:Fibronectin type III domain